MNTVRFAVVGVRNFAAEHIQSIRCLEAEKTGQLTAVVVKDQVRNKGAVEKLQSEGVRVFASVDELLDAGRQCFDILTAPTSIPSHTPIAVKAMEAGFDVVIEKPPAPTIQDLDWLIEVSEKTGRFCSVGFQFIHSVTIRKLKEMIVAGKLGEIQEIACWAYWPRLKSYYDRNPWAGCTTLNGEIVLDGPINNALAHYLNNMLYLASELFDCSEEPQWVQAELYRGHTYITAEDTSCVRIMTRNGIPIHFYVTHCSDLNMGPVMEITGTKATVKWYPMEQERTEVYYTDGRIETFDDQGINPWVQVMRVAARTFRQELDRPWCRPDNCRGFVLSINGAYESSQGVHPIPPNYVREFAMPNGDLRTEVVGIRQHMDTAFTKRKLLSEIGVEWAVPTKPFSLTGYTRFEPKPWLTGQ